MKFIELKLQGLLLAKSPSRTSFCICTFVLFFSACPPSCVHFRPHEVWFCPAYAFLSVAANANANLAWFLEDCASGTTNSFLPQGFDSLPLPAMLFQQTFLESAPSYGSGLTFHVTTSKRPS